jgi:hypothetical protein
MSLFLSSNCDWQEVFLSKTNSFVTGPKVIDAEASHIDSLVCRDPYVLQLSSIALFREKTTYLHLGKPQLQEVLLSKTNEILTGKQCARFCSF